MDDPHTDTEIHQWVALDDGYFTAYENHQPDMELVRQIIQLRPTAHVVTAVRYSCSDCVRNVPRMAAIADHLPGWTWDLFEDSDIERKRHLNIKYVPTFVIYDHEGGTELGRIIENPLTGSLEQDILNLLILG